MKEICICAAVRTKNGYIVRGHRHSDAMRVVRGMPDYKDEHPYGKDQGFVTSLNRYVDRIEGMKLQLDAGIPSADPLGYRSDELYSEDLY